MCDEMVKNCCGCGECESEAEAEAAMSPEESAVALPFDHSELMEFTDLLPDYLKEDAVVILKAAYRLREGRP